MGADQINFSIRYRVKSSIFDKPKREEIEQFILDYSETAEIGPEGGYYSFHMPQYSEVLFDHAMDISVNFADYQKKWLKGTRKSNSSSTIWNGTEMLGMRSGFMTVSKYIVDHGEYTQRIPERTMKS